MEIEPFELERWFDEHEHGADIMLAESGIRSLSADRFDTDPGDLGYVIPTDGDPEFRAAVGDRYGRGREEVAFTCGTQEANFLTVLATLGGVAGGETGDGTTTAGNGEGTGPDADGEHAVVVTPTYQALESVPAAVGEVTTVGLEPPTWELDVDRVADAVRDDTALIALANPNNPTGRYHPEGAIEALYDLAVESDAYLLCDEVYRLLAADPLPPVASMGEHGISTTSLTKAYGLAGLRFGWVAAPREVVDAVRHWKDYTTISPSIFGQHIARQALGDREDEILRENRALADRNREITAAFVDEYGLDWHRPVGVNGFVTVPERFEDGRDFCTAVVEEASVVLAPGEVFGHPDYFRIGFGLPTETLEAGLARVGDVIERGGE